MHARTSKTRIQIGTASGSNYAIVTKAIHCSYTDKAIALGIKDPTPGTISLLKIADLENDLNKRLSSTSSRTSAG